MNAEKWKKKTFFLDYFKKKKQICIDFQTYQYKLQINKNDQLPYFIFN